MSTVEKSRFSKAVETGKRKLATGAVVLTGMLAITGAGEAAAARADDSVTPPETPQQLFQDCEYNAYYSYGGGFMKYVTKKRISNLFVKERVSSTGSSEACDGVADVVWQTQELIGKDADHMHPNTDAVTVHEGTDAFTDSVVQRGYRAFHPGRLIQQVTYLELTPLDPSAGQPVTYEFTGQPAGVR
ncbi:MAG TPA: hypothetical protein VHB72_04535 [Candidatus Saccharimonadales bacterium]|nr:hypothetical protein [Candidatus Saccharimonadales bacterium]